MASEWRETTLGEICGSQGGSIHTGPFGSQLHASDYKVTGIPVVMPANIGDNGIVEEGIMRIGSEDADRLEQHKLNIGDVVFSRRGDVTRNALIQPHEVGWLCGTGCLKVRLGNETRAKAKFISYCLRLPETKEWLVRHAVGATMPNLNTSILSAVPMLLPPMDIQEQISGMLGAIDEKVTLLRETNTTLEAIARGLFKSWFVDFDPVRAKAEGRDPEGVPPEVADLFPSEFENSELGAIPKGWSIGTIGEIAQVIDCLHSKKPDRKESGYTFLQLANILDNGLMDFSDRYYISDDDYKRWVSRMEALPGDCVITNVGRVGAVAQIPEGERAAMGRNMTGVRPRPDFPYPTFLLECFLSGAMRQEIKRLTDVGTILDALNVRSIPSLRFFMADRTVIKAYENVARPLRNRMEHNSAEMASLSSTRNTLLPRLMSGKLRIPGEGR